MRFLTSSLSISGERLTAGSPYLLGKAATLSLSLLISVSVGSAEVSTTGQNQVKRSTGVTEDFLRKELEGRKNLVWTGHTIPDTDSFTASLLAAFIYGGKPGLPGALNPESRFALDECDADEPEVIKDFSGMSTGLVDFNQSTQLPSGIDPDLIAAIIDHHAIGGSPINIPNVISIEIRPWGSTATILMDHASTLGIELPVPLACMGLAAVLSDTVNLSAPTTTEYDKAYALKLAKRAGIDDINKFAERMLLAKSDLGGLSARDIVLLDYKEFEFGGKKVGIGVAETLTAQQLINRRYELKSAIEAQKKESGVDHLIFAIVDTRDHKSYFLWGDDEDKDIVISAFTGKVTDDMFVAEGVISRKRQIGPAIQRAVERQKVDD
ncbi:manganese-dependent inorganic pyrophosphatase [Microbulbifer sp. OS29]|uniref:Manganese-dependent inorganic pyrophosphatase n=1 Tax=Microbulbifer okhotskensis TaxID=2926617 RepID=A0A9X2ENZ3_9GAMM|nr:manganese-dependent inorganic pyrophosphatase [Microbulbifer okhotskensis]MCO1335767.1 manganese-dependent inorganic pyrophosphatase [Microbulbifer okhotskensis]